MSSIQGTKPQQTPLRQIAQLTPVEFAKENKVVTAATLTGAAIITKYAADSGPVLGAIVKKGLVPAIGAGTATMGGLLIHDGFVNAKQIMEEGDQSGSGKLKLAAQLGAGGALVLGGTEIIGHSLNINALKPVTNAAKYVAANPDLAGSLTYMAAGGVGAKFAVDSIQEKGVTAGNGLGLAAAVGSLSVGGALSTMHFAGAGSKITNLAFKGAGAASGVALGVATYGLGKTAVESLKNNDNKMAMLSGVGAVVTGTASIHLLGNATGIPALSNLATKMVTAKPLLTGAVAATAIGVGAYLMYASEKADN